MNWQTRYVPPIDSLWHGCAKAPPHAYFFQHMRNINLTVSIPPPSSALTFALIGFAYGGDQEEEALEGPNAIRTCLATLPLQKAAIHCYDVGNIICKDHDLAASQIALSQVISLLLAQQMTPIVLGGIHALALGHYQGIKQIFSSQRLGILNFDAHFDLNPIAESEDNSHHAFYEIGKLHQDENQHFDYNCIGIQHAANIKRAFNLANRFKTKIILADELHQGLQEKCFDFIDRIIDENDFIYMSLSLDVFATAFAPGVSTAQPLGLTPWQVIPLIRQLAASGKVVSYDITEHLPPHDIDSRTAKLAALLIDEIIHHHRERPHLK